MEILAITVVIFVFVISGYIARRRGVIGDETRNFLNKLVYYFAFPAMTFDTIVKSDFHSTFRMDLVLENVSVTTMLCVASFFMAFLINDSDKRGSFNMGSFRSNQGYMGMPIVGALFGQEAMSKCAIISGFDSAVIIILSVITLEIYREIEVRRQNGGPSKEISKPAIKVLAEKFVGLITNPFVFSAILGIAFAYFKIPIMKLTFISKLLDMTSNLALPLALILIGCSLEIRHLKNNLKIVLSTMVMKLFAAPLLSFALGYFVFGFRGADLAICVTLLSMPSSISSYAMACEMNADENLMATIIGVTTFVSIATITIIQIALKLFI